MRIKMVTLGCTHMDRYVTYSDGWMFKIQTDAKIEDEMSAHIIKHNLDPDGTRFGLWSIPPKGAIITQDELKVFYPQVKPEATSFQVRVAPYYGIDLERLLFNPTTCRPCDGVQPSGTMRLATEHLPRFLRHLLESLAILDKAGIRHDDLRLTNIVVQPTTTETKEQVLHTTLPRLIDFGLASFGTNSNGEDAVGLFNVCHHGMRLLERKMLGDDENEANWVTLACTATSPLVERFNTLTTETLDQLLQLVT